MISVEIIYFNGDSEFFTVDNLEIDSGFVLLEEKEKQVIINQTLIMRMTISRR